MENHQTSDSIAPMPSHLVRLNQGCSFPTPQIHLAASGGPGVCFGDKNVRGGEVHIHMRSGIGI